MLTSYDRYSSGVSTSQTRASAFLKKRIRPKWLKKRRANWRMCYRGHSTWFAIPGPVLARRHIFPTIVAPTECGHCCNRANSLANMIYRLPIPHSRTWLSMSCIDATFYGTRCHKIVMDYICAQACRESCCQKFMAICTLKCANIANRMLNIGDYLTQRNWRHGTIIKQIDGAIFAWNHSSTLSCISENEVCDMSEIAHVFCTFLFLGDILI